jgi:hypothetical protein
MTVPALIEDASEALRAMMTVPGAPRGSARIPGRNNVTKRRDMATSMARGSLAVVSVSHISSHKDRRVTCRVQEDPVGRTGLVGMFGRTEIDHCRLGGIEVVNDHVEVHLLGPLLGRP